MNELIDIMERVGFPIFVTIGLGYYIIKEQHQLKDFFDKQIEKLRETFTKNAEDTNEVISNNNLILAKILEYFRKEDDNDTTTS